MVQPTATLAVNDVVGVDHPNCPGDYRVVKINRRSVDLSPVNGGRDLRVDREMLVPAGTVIPAEPVITTAAQALSRDVLYVEDMGGIYCGAHLGMSAHSAVRARPKARSWNTYGPQGRIRRVVGADLRHMQADFTASGLGTVKCESC